MTKLNYNQIDNSSYEIEFNNSKLGILSMDVNGFYYWQPPNFNGTILPAWPLKDIYKKLEELNKPYNDSINEFFNKID